MPSLDGGSGGSANTDGTGDDDSSASGSSSGAEGGSADGGTATGGSSSGSSGSATDSDSDSSSGSCSSATSGGSGGDGCDGPCGTPGCGECPPANPMDVPNQDFFIAGAEISNGAYLTFLDTNPSLALRSSVCGWNESFEPISQWPPDEARLEYPVVYVNWCQAEAYCTWAGGRLCGRIGGGVNPLSQHAQADKSEWMNACSAGGTQEYPYGPEYEPLACNGEDYEEAASLPVNQPSTCQGSLPGLYNMSGNVYEWTDECDVGQDENDLCRRRGGS